MTNTQYIEKTLSSVERILVDTSTLMTRGFQQFISNNRDRLLSEGKKIVVPKAVYSELIRHTISDNLEKSNLATAAVELIALNKSVFLVDSNTPTEEEIVHSFADAQLLSDLTLHRSNYNQLLITNDRKLSCDAFDLNQQQSCKGRKVLVCYVNWCGELQCCDCARFTMEKSTIKSTTTTTEELSSPVASLSAEISERSPWKFDWRSGLVSTFGTVILYGLYKGGKAILRNIA